MAYATAIQDKTINLIPTYRIENATLAGIWQVAYQLAISLKQPAHVMLGRGGDGNEAFFSRFSDGLQKAGIAVIEVDSKTLQGLIYVASTMQVPLVMYLSSMQEGLGLSVLIKGQFLTEDQIKQHLLQPKQSRNASKGIQIKLNYKQGYVGFLASRCPNTIRPIIVWDFTRFPDKGIVTDLLASLPGRHVALREDETDIGQRIRTLKAWAGIRLNAHATHFEAYDDHGRRLHRHAHLGVMINNLALRTRNDPTSMVITDISAPNAIFKLIRQQGYEPRLAGRDLNQFRLTLNQVNFALADHESGLFFGSLGHCMEDALFSAVMFIRAISQLSHGLSHWCEESLSSFYERSYTFKIANKQRTTLINRLAQQLEKRKIAHVKLEGLRAAFGRSEWILLPHARNDEISLMLRGLFPQDLMTASRHITGLCKGLGVNLDLPLNIDACGDRIRGM